MVVSNEGGGVCVCVRLCFLCIMTRALDRAQNRRPLDVKSLVHQVTVFSCLVSSSQVEAYSGAARWSCSLGSGAGTRAGTRGGTQGDDSTWAGKSICPFVTRRRQKREMLTFKLVLYKQHKRENTCLFAWFGHSWKVKAGKREKGTWTKEAE